MSACAGVRQDTPGEGQHSLTTHRGFLQARRAQARLEAESVLAEDGRVHEEGLVVVLVFVRGDQVLATNA